MPLRIGATEAEREQVIAALRAGKSYEAATAPLAGVVEPEWIVRNEQHLREVAKKGEKKPSLVDTNPKK